MSLTVLYDAGCPVCRGAAGWLARQVQLVRLDLVPAGSAAARERFPALDHDRTRREITVVGADGAVYRGDTAWAVVLWALESWRPMSDRRGFVAFAARWGERWRAMAKDEDCGDRCQAPGQG
ncbi:DCC1-like thiol-disulfide oxidoreductase family protein [Actinosynnema sp. NPDC020468]|uniref:thiol-disulfide oxidoreductase DCC family protein n=1 Tax=Actinosynnema sp. NPDC020468 TaxID=3154488 RepID=UPI0033C20F59